MKNQADGSNSLWLESIEIRTHRDQINKQSSRKSRDVLKLSFRVRGTNCSTFARRRADEQGGRQDQATPGGLPYGANSYRELNPFLHIVPGTLCEKRKSRRFRYWIGNLTKRSARVQMSKAAQDLRTMVENNRFTEMCSGSEAGSYLRLIESCITQLKAEGLGSFNESKKEEEEASWVCGTNPSFFCAGADE